ncbi:MAG: MarC family protein [Bacteroidales bacterium]|nr:MarC family protein [Bacteroidales bacterium]
MILKTFFSELNIIDIFSSFMVLFAVIDIIGSIPIILDLKAKNNKVESGKATLAATLVLLLFLFIGEGILNIFGVDIASFAIAGSFILLALAIEMILGVELFKGNTSDSGGASIVAIAFPLVAGAGSITTLLSLKAEYATINIVIAVLLNMMVVYLVLKSTKFIERILGKAGVAILKKVFGIILLSLAIKLFLSNTGIDINEIK